MLMKKGRRSKHYSDKISLSQFFFDTHALHRYAYTHTCNMLSFMDLMYRYVHLHVWLSCTHIVRHTQRDEKLANIVCIND